MKSKYLGLTMIVLSLLAVGTGGWLQIRSAGTSSGRSGLPPMFPISDFKVPGADQLDKMDRLERATAFLATPAPGGRSRADLSALGYVPVESFGTRNANSDKIGPAREDYQVTLAFEGRFRRFCVIDGCLYAEGAVTPDGASIMKIESKRVLVNRQNMQRWVAVEPVFTTASAEDRTGIE